MNVEISVALNFVISYLYNRLPRRRVDLFGEELEAGLEKKFQGHWYPDKPNKGSGYRCVKANGDEVDPVLMEATVKAGLDITEVKNYLPDDLTLWIDPSEVSYKIGEKGPVKVLYSDKKDDDVTDTMDKEVQAANRTFNPEAQTFTPEAQTTFSPDVLAFNPELTNFCTDSSQSFQTIDSISSSLSNLSLSPSSPLPPGTWSTATSPSSNLFSSALPASTATPPTFLGPRPNHSSRQHFTAATFAQTKFGSTKLKTQVKRPNRLSPTEFGNFFRQQQRSYSGPQRPRSLSPRDPRVEFLWDQQQRMLIQQQSQQQHHHHHHQQQQQQHPQHQQMSPTMPYGGMQYHNNQQHLHRQQQQQQQQHHHQQQQLSPTGMYPDFLRQHSSGISSSHSSPHMSPQGTSPAFQDLIQQSVPNQRSTLASPTTAISRPNSLGVHMGRGPSGFPMGLASSMSGSNGEGFGHGPRPLSQASGGALSPDQPHAPFVDGLGVAPVNYSNGVQHLLMAN